VTSGYLVGDRLAVALIDPEPHHVRKISRELGLQLVPLTRAADVEIRFVDLGGARRSGSDTSGLDLGRGPLLPGRAAGGNAWAQVVLGDADVLRIECDRTLNSPPSLAEILNLALLQHGVLSVHAASVLWNGHGVMIAGWRGGGKTDALLALLSFGARLIADEWTLIGPDAAVIRALPSPVRLRTRHLAEIPALRSLVSGSARRRLRVLSVMRATTTPFAGLRGSTGRLARGLAARLADEAHVDLPMDHLRAAPGPIPAHSIIALTPVSARPRRPYRIEPAELAERLGHVHEHHRQGLMQQYHQFRYAYPDRAFGPFETVAQTERALTERLLAGVPAWVCEVDRDAAISALGATLLPLMPTDERA
jgi:hypothetical protein